MPQSLYDRIGEALKKLPYVEIINKDNSSPLMDDLSVGKYLVEFGGIEKDIREARTRLDSVIRILVNQIYPKLNINTNEHIKNLEPIIEFLDKNKKIDKLLSYVKESLKNEFGEPIGTIPSTLLYLGEGEKVYVSTDEAFLKIKPKIKE